MSENFRPDTAASESKEVSRLERFKTVLTIFGTDKARENFIKKCEEYLAARNASAGGWGAGADPENYRASARGAAYTTQGRAETHNYIMDVLQRLATQAKTLTPEQESALRSFSAREEVAQAIREFILNRTPEKKIAGEDLDEEDEDDDDEDEEEDDYGKKITAAEGDDKDINGGDPRGKSGVAYWHSLGKEH